MKIAILEPYIEGIGGAQRVIADYANFLETRGHSVEIFTQRVNLKTAYPSFKKLKINLLRPSWKFLVPFLFIFKKFRGFDVVIANDWPTNFASIRNKNVVWVCYSPKRDFYDLKEYYIKEASLFKKITLSLKSLVFSGIDKLAAKKAKLLLPISKTVQKRTQKYYNLPGKIFYPGINFKEYKSGKYSDYVLSVARFVKPKRVELIIKAMNYVKNNKIKLYLVGAGPLEAEIKNIIKNKSNIVFLGDLSDKELKGLYSNCLAIVYVPKDEDWGLIPLEAGASEKLTIGVNEGGLKETIIDGKTGFLIKEINPEKIAEKIDFLANDKKIAEKIGEAAKKYTSRFDWKNILPMFEKRIISSSKLFK